MNTPNCMKVWFEILQLRSAGVDTKKLEEAFCDFECSWKEHNEEHHM